MDDWRKAEVGERQVALTFKRGTGTNAAPRAQDPGCCSVFIVRLHAWRYATHSSTDDELHVLLQTVFTRLMKLLTRRGVLIEEMGQIYLAETMTTVRRRAPYGRGRLQR